MIRKSYYIHCATSVMLLAACLLLSSGKDASLLFPWRISLTVLAVIGVIFLATFVPCCAPFRRGNASSSVLMVVIMAMVDICLCVSLVSMVGRCLSNEEEFWGEDQTFDVGECQEGLPQAKGLTGGLKAVARTSESLGLTDYPHWCVGVVSNCGPGVIFARVRDPETGDVLGVSGKRDTDAVSAEECSIAFSLRCRMFCGRRSRRYVVRCEVVHVSRTGEERVLKAAYVRTNGYY